MQIYSRGSIAVIFLDLFSLLRGFFSLLFSFVCFNTPTICYCIFYGLMRVNRESRGFRHIGSHSHHHNKYTHFYKSHYFHQNDCLLSYSNFLLSVLHLLSVIDPAPPFLKSAFFPLTNSHKILINSKSDSSHPLKKQPKPEARAVLFTHTRPQHPKPAVLAHFSPLSGQGPPHTL